MPRISTVDSDDSLYGDRTYTQQGSPTRRRSRNSIDMSDHDNFMRPRYHAADMEYHKGIPAARMRGSGLRSSWNDVLTATCRPILDVHQGGYDKITDPPHMHFPNLDFFAEPPKVDYVFLGTLPEFSHWQNTDFGDEVKRKHIRLLRHGKVSLIYLFLRGLVWPRWYNVVCKLPGFEDRNALETLQNSHYYEQYPGEERQVEDDFDEVSRAFWQKPGFPTASSSKYTPRADASKQPIMTILFHKRPHNQARKAPTQTSESKEMRRSASDAYLPSIRTADTWHSKSKPTERKSDDMPTSHIHWQPATEAGPSSHPHQHQAPKPFVSNEEEEEEEEECNHIQGTSEKPTQQRRSSDVVSLPSSRDDFTQHGQDGLALDMLQRIGTELEHINRVAAECLALFQRMRARREGTDEFEVDGGGLSGGGSGKVKGKGKEPMWEM